jgi:DNA helicase-2/ATP-dependent DNA helicase PcrA
MSSQPLAESILAALDADQAAAATALRGPVCIVAGAGSGKTRTVSHRIAYGIATGVYAANRILALTYTNRAAAELRVRLRKLGASAVQVRTFHSAALSQLQFFWPQLTETSAPKLVTNKQQLLAEVLQEHNIKLTDAQRREVIAEIEWLKYSMTDPSEYPDLNRGSIAGLNAKIFLNLQNGYELLKQKRKVMDWEDVLLLTIGLLRSEPRMLNHVQQQFRFFTVDEYQDISPLQQALLETWLGERQDICVVGDPRQTIYSFAGASSDFLMGFSSDRPEAEVFNLDNNYRSSSEIVTLANSIAVGRKLEAVRSSGGGPEIRAAKSADAQISDCISGLTQALASGMRPKQLAVLSRINSQLEPIEKGLLELGIPVQVRGAGRFFRRPEVLQVMNAIRALQLTQSDDPLFIELSKILASMGWRSRPEVSEKWEALNWFFEVLEEIGDDVSLEEYVRELEERERSGHEPIRDAVTLATVHATKGLEWDRVHLIGMNQGLFPISHATSESEIAEEKRLFYVAITRARDKLVISHNSAKPISQFL